MLCLSLPKKLQKLSMRNSEYFNKRHVAHSMYFWCCKAQSVTMCVVCVDRHLTAGRLHWVWPVQQQEDSSLIIRPLLRSVSKSHQQTPPTKDRQIFSRGFSCCILSLVSSIIVTCYTMQCIKLNLHNNSWWVVRPFVIRKYTEKNWWRQSCVNQQ